MDKKKKEQLLALVVELVEHDHGFLLTDLKIMYFAALRSQELDPQHIRDAVTCSFIDLHDFFMKVDMILEDKDSCHTLAC